MHGNRSIKFLWGDIEHIQNMSFLAHSAREALRIVIDLTIVLLQLDLPDVYRGQYRDEETAGEKYGAQAEILVQNIKNRGAKVGTASPNELRTNVCDFHL